MIFTYVWLSCGTNRICSGGTCGEIEVVCDDNVDNDRDGSRDCADLDCDQKTCGTGCVCKSRAKTETLCTDDSDNDGDGKRDCQDTDCPCPTGKTCKLSSNKYVCG